MTPQEAIYILKYTPVTLGRNEKTTISEYNAMLNLAEEALEKQIPKKPIHIHKEYDKHDWHKNSDGTVDENYWEYDIHSGVQCKRCGKTVCTLCYEDYDEEAEECVIDENLCPNCKRTIGKSKYCSDCGQALCWEW